MRRRTWLLSLLTLVALCGPVSVLGAPVVEAESSDEASAATYLVERVNTVRERHGLAPLRVKADLSRHARAHSASMSRQRTLFHTASFQVLCCWSSISENVAFNGSARGAHRSLMGSAPHRANILDPAKRGIGVGVVEVGDRLWVTQVFRQGRG